MKLIALYISITAIFYAICFHLDGQEIIHNKVEGSSSRYTTYYEYSTFHHKEFHYRTKTNDSEVLIKERLVISWDSVSNILYACIVLIVLEVLRIQRNKENKPLSFVTKKIKKSRND